MNRNPKFPGNRIIFLVAGLFFILSSKNSSAQTTLILGSPLTNIYGLTSNGQIYEINTTTAATSRTIKNGTYSGNSASNSNGLAYNSLNGKFYYFKRNVGSSNQEFVSFDPKTNTVTILAISTCTADVHTGCISFDGKGYYTVDTNGNLNYYDISANSWTMITSNIIDQYNADVDAVIRSQSAGDMAIDGYGTIWLVTSSNTNYGIYKFPAPTAVTSQLKVTRVIAPTATTPSNNSIAGIAFDANGRIFMGTRGDDGLYLLQNSTTLTYVGKFSNSDAGNDLTSLNFPFVSVLPVKWIDFNASLQNNTTVTLGWKVVEENNRGFYIQHSPDANNWETVSFIASRNSTETEESYSYSYSVNLSGIQYYRIKQVDLDGKESYTAVRTVSFTSENTGATSVWPNPARNVINITNTADAKLTNNAKVQLYDLSGKLSMEKQLQQGVNSIDISSLATGTYIVKANAGNSFTQKIIKQ